MSDEQFPQKPETAHSLPALGANDPFLDNLEGAAEALLGNATPVNTDDTPTIISKNKPISESRKFPRDPFAHLKGKTLAHFELIEPVGVGGMAAVLRARDTQLDRIVALKILPPDMAVEPENVRRFHQEARAAAKLDHENIARVFYCGEDDGLHFIAFEFVEGENLKALSERQGPLPVEQAVHYMLQAAAGLAHAASRGVVHRDIKPSNIIITPTGRAKLVDMGLARSIELHDGQALTQSGVTLGTFEYISPEQALEPRTADVRSDIYSLGCTFYHVLTGQPPVPEGTAAKKLHHHQHVAPLDPRQLNPAIPDSVAAILGRMMAKDPRGRYQRAEHLVQHLLQVAQQLGAVEQRPEGLLYVDAPLPNAPQKRPGLLIGLGLVGLVGTVLLLSLVSSASNPGRPQEFSPRTETGQLPKAVGIHPDKPGVREAQPGSPPAALAKVKNAAEFQAAAHANPAVRHIWLQGDITTDKELVVGGAPSVDGQPRTLTIQSDPTLAADNPARLIFKVGSPSGKKARAALHVLGGEVILKNLHLVVDTGKTTPTIPVAAVAVEKAGDVTCLDCTFTQEAPVERLTEQRGKKILVASVALYNPDGETQAPTARFTGCWFERGQTAVAIEGPATVHQSNCAFGPHSSLFHLYGDGTGKNRVSVSLEQCSALIVNGPAFRINDQVACLLKVQRSIFDGPGVLFEPGRILIQQTDVTAPDVREPLVVYQGSQNCYRNLNGYWVFGDNSPQDKNTFLKTVEAQGGGDLDLRELDASKSPWECGDPLKKLQDGQPRAAFRIDPKLPELRQKNQHPLGVEQCAFGTVYDHLPLPPLTPVAPVELAKKKIIVVDPSGELHPDYKTFTMVSAAMDEAAGAEIQIKYNGKLPMRLKEIGPKMKGLILKPYENCRPILTLDTEGSSEAEEAALFRLAGGQITFEKLAFLLHPDRKLKSQSVVTFASGGGQCAFKDCLFTLKGADADDYQVPLNLVSVPPVTLPEGTLPAALAIDLKGCFVRGQGTFLSLPQTAPFDLKIEDSLIALDGEFVYVAGDLAQVPDEKLTANIQLLRTTLCLSESLLHLAQEKGKNLISTRVRAENCLFPTGDENNPLVKMEGLDSRPQQVRLLAWAGKHNAYCGYDKYLDAQLAEINMAPVTYRSKTWSMVAGEMKEGEVRCRYLAKPIKLPEGKGLPSLLPSDFKASIEALQETDTKDQDSQPPLLLYGVNLPALESRLPLTVPPAAALPLALTPTNPSDE